jgi:hypothetical protein
MTVSVSALGNVNSVVMSSRPNLIFAAGTAGPLGPPARRQGDESFAGGLKDCLASRRGLIAPINDIDIERASNETSIPA